MLALLGFILAIGPLVFVHEMGHYLMARRFGIGAEVFSIGFGRPLLKWRDRRGTEWRVGWIPLGGYVKFAGDMGATSQPDAAWLALPPAERNRTFQSKPLWQRALVVAAGPAANFLFAILALMALFAAVGEPKMPPVVGRVAPQSAAADAGLKVGDRITAIDGESVDGFDDIALLVSVKSGQPVRVDYLRGGAARSVTITPRAQTGGRDMAPKVARGVVGIASGPVQLVRPKLLQLPGAAVAATGDILQSQFRGLRQIITGERSAKELSGPIGTARVSGEVVTLGLVSFVFFMVFVSINLGFINLLPIPTLDGGHLLLYAIEGALGRSLPGAVVEGAFRWGLAALLGLMLFVTFNDLSSAFG